MQSTIKLLTVIMPRGTKEALCSFLLDKGVLTCITANGVGTATQDWASILGLGDSKKDVVFAPIISEDAEKLLNEIDKQFNLSAKGVGVAFTLNINGLSSRTTYDEIMKGRNE